MPERDEPNPARVVADADVLAADLLLGGDAREALDHVRRHSWVELVASDPLLAQTERLVSKLADPALAADHRERASRPSGSLSTSRRGPPRALASAYRGEAAHLLSSDERLRSAKAGLTLQPRVSVSVRPPDAFARLFDPESLYEAVKAASTRGRIGILERSRGGPAREATTVPRAGSHELIERRESYPTGARSIEGL